ncbi:hypothetical protein CR513_17317, partial [Mucuna pruriens]
MRRSEVDGLPLDAFIDVLGLTVCGIVLFPHLNDYTSSWPVRKKERIPVTVVLANTYYTIHNCHEKKGGRLVCCLHALYLWLMAHTFTSKCTTSCPIEDFKWCCVKKRTRGE